MDSNRRLCPWEMPFNFHERRILVQKDGAVLYVCIPSRKDIAPWFEVETEKRVQYFKSKGNATKSFNREVHK